MRSASRVLSISTGRDWTATVAPPHVPADSRTLPAIPTPRQCYFPQVWVQAASLFFGVLLLETGSSWFNALLCVLTIVTISLSLWTIADMDLPFSSSFHRVKFESLSVKLLALPHNKPSTAPLTLRNVVQVMRLSSLSKAKTLTRISRRVPGGHDSGQRDNVGSPAIDATSCADAIRTNSSFKSAKGSAQDLSRCITLENTELKCGSEQGPACELRDHLRAAPPVDALAPINKTSTACRPSVALALPGQDQKQAS